MKLPLLILGLSLVGLELAAQGACTIQNAVIIPRASMDTLLFRIDHLEQTGDSAYRGQDARIDSLARLVYGASVQRSRCDSLVARLEANLRPSTWDRVAQWAPVVLGAATVVLLVVHMSKEHGSVTQQTTHEPEDVDRDDRWVPRWLISRFRGR